MLITKLFTQAMSDKLGQSSPVTLDAVNTYQEISGFEPQSPQGLTADELQHLKKLLPQSNPAQRFAINAPLYRESAAATKLAQPDFWNSLAASGNFYESKKSDAQTLIDHLRSRSHILGELNILTQITYSPFILTTSEKIKIRNERTVDPEALDQSNITGINLSKLLRIIAPELKADFLQRTAKLLSILVRDRSNKIVPAFILTASTPFIAKLNAVDTDEPAVSDPDDRTNLDFSIKKTFAIDELRDSHSPHIVMVPIKSSSPSLESSMYVALVSENGTTHAEDVIEANLEALTTFVYDQSLRKQDPEVVFNGKNLIFI